MSPRFSHATHMTGVSATLMGITQFGFAALIIGGWLYSRPAYRKWGIAAAVTGLLIATLCPAAGIYLNN